MEIITALQEHLKKHHPEQVKIDINIPNHTNQAGTTHTTPGLHIPAPWQTIYIFTIDNNLYIIQYPTNLHNFFCPPEQRNHTTHTLDLHNPQTLPNLTKLLNTIHPPWTRHTHTLITHIYTTLKTINKLTHTLIQTIGKII